MTLFKSLAKFICLLVLVCWLLVLFFLGAGLSFKNDQLVDVDLILFSFSQQPLGLVLAAAIFTGLFLAILLLVPVLYTLKFRLKLAKVK